ALGIDAIDEASGLLVLRQVALIVGIDAVARIGEPDAAVGLDDDVVRAVEALAVEFVRERDDGAVDLRARDAPVAVLAGDEAALTVDGVAVGIPRGLAEDGNRAVAGVEPQHPIVGDVGPDEILAGREIGRPFGPAAAGVELGDFGVSHEQAPEALVEYLEAAGGPAVSSLEPVSVDAAR